MPLLGKAVRHEWALDWDFLSVNHGSFGAAPRVVLAAQRDWQRQMEAQPGRFMRAGGRSATAPGATRRVVFSDVRMQHRLPPFSGWTHGVLISIIPRLFAGASPK